jgi:hypothetical protein
LLFIFGVFLRFAGVAPRVRRTCSREPGSSVDAERFARSCDFSIVNSEFTADWISGLYRVLLSRPKNYAIVRNSSELADESQYFFFKRLIRAKKLAGAPAFEWL